MKDRKSLFPVILISFFIAGISLLPSRPVFCQESIKSDTQKEPLSEWSKQWLEEVVPYIITPAEKELFLKLPNEAERGKFIQNFWEKKDPDPSTPENEFKTAYYQRIALANKFFGASGLAGWKTDRGRIYILLGPPNEIQRDFNPSVHSAIALDASKEIWGYWNLPNPNLPYNLEFVFVDEFGTGNFVLERSVAPREGGAAPFDMRSLQYHFDRMEIVAEALKNPFENTRKLREIITTQVTYNLIPFDYDVFCLKGTGKTAWAPLVVEIPYSSLSSKKIEDKSYCSLTLMVNVSNPLGQTIFQKSRELNFQHPSSEVPLLGDQNYQFQTALTLEPGDYGLHLLLLDNFSGKIGTSHRNVIIADFSGTELAASDIVLTGEASEPGDTTPARKDSSEPQLALPGLQLNRLFKLGREMTITFEVYNVSLHPETGLNSVAVEYLFFQEGKLVTRVPSSRQDPTVQKDFRIRTSLRLKNFKPGEYRLQAKVTDELAKTAVTKETLFHVVE